ncbi:hypothetical protein BC828DRAFT_406410 [Blastocladiella britannica]|nr:hypothetical protein BC828DRAFT_406410 [Blastocladiella britannica]
MLATIATLFLVLSMIATSGQAAPTTKVYHGSAGLLLSRSSSSSSLSSTSSSLGKRGEATFYNPGGGYGSCGNLLQDTQLVVALPAVDYASGAAICGSCVKISYGGSSVSATVADKCPECATGDVDMTPAVFTALFGAGSASRGRIAGVTWSRCTSGPSSSDEGGSTASVVAAVAAAVPESVPVSVPVPISSNGAVQVPLDGALRCSTDGSELSEYAVGRWWDVTLAHGTKCVVGEGGSVAIAAA